MDSSNDNSPQQYTAYDETVNFYGIQLPSREVLARHQAEHEPTRKEAFGFMTKFIKVGLTALQVFIAIVESKTSTPQDILATAKRAAEILVSMNEHIGLSESCSAGLNDAIRDGSDDDIGYALMDHTLQERWTQCILLESLGKYEDAHSDLENAVYGEHVWQKLVDESGVIDARLQRQAVRQAFRIHDFKGEDQKLWSCIDECRYNIVEMVPRVESPEN